jgi:phosphopantetheinyl transferase (holo-ACP synthase)
MNDKNNQHISNLKQYEAEVSKKSLHKLMEEGQIVQPEDKKSELMMETLSTLFSLKEAQKELIEQFKNGDVNVGFDDIYTIIDKLAKQEFEHRYKLLQLVKA